jgi:putative FmdB family regulatory protein
MPSYEFSCPTCGITFDKFLPLEADHAQVRCPAGHRNARRIYTTIPVFFKGSGFYVTDHASEPRRETGGGT